jgi:hypothetical protein
MKGDTMRKYSRMQVQAICDALNKLGPKLPALQVDPAFVVAELADADIKVQWVRAKLEYAPAATERSPS